MVLLDTFKGIKVLEVGDNYFIASKGYKLVKYDFKQKSYEYLAQVLDRKYGLFARFSLLKRFLRAEITGLYTLKNGDCLLIAKKGIFSKGKESNTFKKVFSVPRGSKPLNICELPNGHIYFGEYFANVEKKAVHVYASLDGGMTWQIAFSFSEGNINHIHGLFWDQFTDKLWFCTGDRKNECIIGYTEDEFKTITEVFRGDQEFRSCQLFFYETFIVFATDSQYMQNEIKMFDRDTLEITSIAEIQGTAIKGGQLGAVSFLSTTVEPSKVNMDSFSHVWMTKNGTEWAEVYKSEKDVWPAILQFGSIEFPRYTNSSDAMKRLFFSGRALKKIDGSSLSISID